MISQINQMNGQHVPMTPCCISSCWRRAADW